MIGRIRARLSSSPGLRGIGKMTLASAAGQIAIMSTLPIVTRLYAPAEFGIYSLLASFNGVAAVAACLCLDLAIVQGADHTEADELFAAALRSVTFTAVVSGLAMTLLIRANLFGFGALSFVSVPIIIAMVAANGIYLASRYRQLREQQFGLIATASLSQNLGRALAPLCWFPMTHGWVGLALGELTGRILGISRLLGPFARRARDNPAFHTTSVWISVVRREWRYTGVLLASVVIDSTSSLIIAPIIVGSYGQQPAGEYYLITTFLNAPLALIGAAFADVIHTRTASLAVANPRAIPAFVLKSAGALLAMGIVLYVPVYFLGPLVLPIVFGQKWTWIVTIARALTPFMIMALVASPCSRVLIAVRQTGVKVLADVLRLAVAPLAILIAARMRMPFGDAIQWFGGVMTVLYAIYFGVQYMAALRVSRRGLPRSTAATLPTQA